MPPERDPEDEATGFETSAELRRDDSESPFPPPALDRARTHAGARLPRLTWTGWIGWAMVTLVVVILGGVIYILVSFL
jgi:flagellar biosynthesis/type III secretory pathway M-ring protein FliF/YscJ